MGHVYLKDGIRPDPSKYDVVRDCPVPTNGDDVRRFVAFANYYRKFIPNFSIEQTDKEERNVFMDEGMPTGVWEFKKRIM